MLHKAWNSKEEMPYCFPRSSIKFQGHTGQNITDFDPNWAFPNYRPVAAFKSLRFALLSLCKYKLDPVNHTQIWQVSLQLSDTCQIWMWYWLDVWFNHRLAFEIMCYRYAIILMKFFSSVDIFLWSLLILINWKGIHWNVSEVLFAQQKTETVKIFPQHYSYFLIRVPMFMTS